MDEFTQAVFEVAYHSRAQRNLRRLMMVLLALKHSLRGMLFSWPLYLLFLVSFALPEVPAWSFALLLIPAIALSGFILIKGMREDYTAMVRGKLIKPTEWRQFWRAD